MRIKRKQIIEFLISIAIMVLVIIFVAFIYMSYMRWQNFMALCGFVGISTFATAGGLLREIIV